MATRSKCAFVEVFASNSLAAFSIKISPHYPITRWLCNNW